MLWFEIPWIIMGSTLFEMVYRMNFYYYFTFIESQQNNEHKANTKACICNLSQASDSIINVDNFFSRTICKYLACFPSFSSHIRISMFFPKLCLKTILASLSTILPFQVFFSRSSFLNHYHTSSIKSTLLPLLSFHSWLFCDKRAFYIRFRWKKDKFHGRIFRINLFLEIDSLSRLWQGFPKSRSKLTMINIIPDWFIWRLPPLHLTLALHFNEISREKKSLLKGDSIFPPSLTSQYPTPMTS